MRPLGIPTIQDRVKQMLLKLALEPEWEALFEINSYGFRPGRSCHDAIYAIYASIVKKPKYVLDADISSCFDRINHQALLEKLNTRPSFKRQIKAWLKAGVIDFSSWAKRKGYNQTHEGTPQGGVISPLLANIALHGMENCIEQAFPSNKTGYIRRATSLYGRINVSAPTLIRYADDFVILCDELAVVQQCQEIITNWLSGMGLELKPSKTRLAHTLVEFNNERRGLNFLGFNIRQYQVGKHHSGCNTKGEILGYKTIVKPSEEKIRTHYESLSQWCDKLKGNNQVALIAQLNPIIRGWCNYQSPWSSKKSFSKISNLMWNKLWRWAKRRHPRKGKKWIAKKYWRTIGNDNWTFATAREGKNPLALLKHPSFKAGIGWVKVQGSRTPFDGDWAYWSERMGEKYKILDSQKARLIKRQNNKCAYCGQNFKPEDNLEKHHLELKSRGGKNTDDNMVLLHLHCHDQIHAYTQQEYDNWVQINKAEIAQSKLAKRRSPTKQKRHKQRC